MPLSERNTNGTMPRNGDGKRKRGNLGDEADDDVDAPVKGRKSGQSTHRARNVPPTPPTSSAQSATGSSVAPTRSVHTEHESMYGGLGNSFSKQHSEAERDAWLADETHQESSWLVDSVDLNEEVSSSQDDADGSDLLQHYGDLATKIVGLQYYRGYANPGEQILMRREPGNPYDTNAIRIDNVAGVQIGHIPRTIAAKIAKYIDNRWLHMEGQLAGEKGQFDVPLTIHIYGPKPDSPEGRDVQEKMKADKIPMKALMEAERRQKQQEKERLAAARKAAAAGKKGQFVNQASSVGIRQSEDMSEIMEASQRINPRDIGQAADSHGLSEEQLKDMPMASTPNGIRTKMLPYQLQALQWLLDQESPQAPVNAGESVQLWSKNPREGFTNLATTTTQANPTFASGGILADDMGLGKTLEMISLIVADTAKSGKGSTLIVAPLSVMSNWSSQIAAHVKESHMLDVYTYHGAGRVNLNAADFSKYDIVITTYQTLASDYMPSKVSKLPEKKIRSSGLYSMNWRRVILDEGHQVRNPKAKVAAAVIGLMARSRWVLTGTPIVNSLKDLYSLLRFVGVSGGLEQLDIYNRVLVRPLKDGDPSATFLLQAIMAAFTLRRRKDMAYIDLKLPKLDEFVHRIEFSEKERKRYEALNAEAQGLLRKYQKKAGAGKGSVHTYQHLLEILLRMRQCCNHWQLCGERVTNLLAQLEDHEKVDLTPENKKALQDLLQIRIESHEDCAVCLETLSAFSHQPVITTCGHIFGYECIARVMETQHKCPMCRAELKDNTDLIEPSNECGDESAAHDLDLTQSSSKLEALVNILGAIKASGKDKTIIFSQWTSFLDIVQNRLESEGYELCRIDGTMSSAKRDESLRALESSTTTVMLASLGVCAVGLNLTAANHVVLADTWWAPAIEDQAVDRVHRLGQSKQTKVWRLVVDSTIEERTLEVQHDKRKLMALAFSEKSSKRERASGKGGRLADIEKLLA